MAKKKMWANSQKAATDLGFNVAPADEALRRAVEWFVANHYAPPAPAQTHAGAATRA
jgi:dihydroflavonol-4-reductase